MLVLPDTQVFGRNPAFGRHAGGFRDDQPRSTHGPTAQVDKMPVAGETIDGRVLAHGRNGDPVFELDTFNSNG